MNKANDAHLRHLRFWQVMKWVFALPFLLWPGNLIVIIIFGAVYYSEWMRTGELGGLWHMEYWGLVYGFSMMSNFLLLIAVGIYAETQVETTPEWIISTMALSSTVAFFANLLIGGIHNNKRFPTNEQHT